MAGVSVLLVDIVSVMIEALRSAGRRGSGGRRARSVFYASKVSVMAFSSISSRVRAAG
jgi:hypothetical protein